MVPISALQPGDSPRLEGEDKTHIAWLAETDAQLPPILVERQSMRVIDGMHRLRAAALKQQEMIAVEFFDGSAADAFLLAVEMNVTHGLPLSPSDRRAAAARIMVLHPELSDRAIGESSGLAARTVAAIRRRSTDARSHLNARIGRDGRVRPLSGVEGRRRAAELLAERPEASLREVAENAGVSPATVRDVRMRLERGEAPASERSIAAHDAALPWAADPPLVQAAPTFVLEKLLRDPSLLHNEKGRWLLRLLQRNAVGAQEWTGAVSAVPAHCATSVLQLARHYAQMWLNVAQQLDERVRVIDPLSSRRVADREA
jgi:ParB/Sulfiredoxin domain